MSLENAACPQRTATRLFCVSLREARGVLFVLYRSSGTCKKGCSARPFAPLSQSAAPRGTRSSHRQICRPRRRGWGWGFPTRSTGRHPAPVCECVRRRVKNRFIGRIVAKKTPFEVDPNKPRVDPCAPSTWSTSYGLSDSGRSPGAQRLVPPRPKMANIEPNLAFGFWVNDRAHRRRWRWGSVSVPRDENPEFASKA